MSAKFSPADLCKLFGISKSTLFRWESEDWFPAIRRGDDSRQREYGIEHVQTIASHKIEKLENAFVTAYKRPHLESLRELHLELSFRKVLAGDLIGLKEMDASLSTTPERSEEYILRLVAVALNHYSPRDTEFLAIIRVVEHLCHILQEILESEAAMV